MVSVLVLQERQKLTLVLVTYLRMTKKRRGFPSHSVLREKQQQKVRLVLVTFLRMTKRRRGFSSHSV